MIKLDSAKKRVLMIAYYFPPLSGSGVFRSIKFAKYLSDFGWQPTVIAADAPPFDWDFADDTQLREIPSDIEVVRIKDIVGENGILSVLDEEQSKQTLNFLAATLKRDEEAENIFEHILSQPNGVDFMLRFPCPSLSWAKDVLTYLAHRKDLNDFDLVYTTSGPYSAQLVGFYLNEVKKIPWVADYRDEWTFNHAANIKHGTLHSRLLFALERLLLKTADCNLTVSEPAVSNYEEYFGLKNGENIVCITNGYDEKDFREFPEKFEKNERFTINYSGLIYAGQSILPIMQAIGKLTDEKSIPVEDIRFRIIGESIENIDKIGKDFGLESIFEVKGYSPHGEALKSYVTADINLLFLGGDNEKYKGVYTGKIFEQLRSGRPILCIGAKGGVADKILRESGLGETFLSRDIEGIKRFILNEYKRHKSSKALVRRFPRVIKRFERKHLTGDLANVFDKVLKGKR